MQRKTLTALLAAAAISVLAIAPSTASVWAPADEATILKANGFSGVNLVPGTEPFNADVVGAVLKGLGL